MYMFIWPLPSRYVQAGKTYCRNGPHSNFEGNIIPAQAVQTGERSHPAVFIFIRDDGFGYDTCISTYLTL